MSSAFPWISQPSSPKLGIWYFRNEMRIKRSKLTRIEKDLRWAAAQRLKEVHKWAKALAECRKMEDELERARVTDKDVKYVRANYKSWDSVLRYEIMLELLKLWSPFCGGRYHDRGRIEGRVSIKLDHNCLSKRHLAILKLLADDINTFPSFRGSGTTTRYIFNDIPRTK